LRLFSWILLIQTQSSFFFKNQKPFDILVNSAGMGRHSPSLETSTEDFDEVMDVNLRGAYFLTQAVARGLIKAKKTRLTN